MSKPKISSGSNVSSLALSSIQSLPILVALYTYGN
jgi:hypothetical protein